MPPALMLALRRLRALAPNTHGVFRRSANAKALRLLRDKVRLFVIIFMSIFANYAQFYVILYTYLHELNLLV